MLALWLGVMAVGAALRLDHLADRPMHADEATGARITGQRMEQAGGHFNPTHFHGPLLADLASVCARGAGESGWTQLSKSSLRIGVVVMGCCVVGMPWFWRRRMGDSAALAAAAMLATSPLLVYYSRMFIHEMGLVLFGLGVLAAVLRFPRWGIPGVMLGMMFGFKETFAISVLAWAGAGAIVAMENRRDLRAMVGVANWRMAAGPIIASVASALLTATIIYTDGFHYAKGAIDAVRTFFVYETVGGHDKPADYYGWLLVMPKKALGLWWSEGILLVLAIIAYAMTWRRELKTDVAHRWVRFLTYAAAGHFLIYSIIAYKTPWLACLPWAHVCMLAGFGLSALRGSTRGWQLAGLALVAAAVVTQTVQSRRATGRFSNDPRNPYAYVPTLREVESLAPWLRDLGSVEPIAVIGDGYWPLPWYLREFPQTGYWREAPADLKRFPVVIATSGHCASINDRLADTHVSLPRGLRAGEPIGLWMKNDLWQKWTPSAPH